MGRKSQELGANSWKCRTAMFGLWCNKLIELFLHFQDTVLYEGQAGSFPSLGGQVIYYFLINSLMLLRRWFLSLTWYFYLFSVEGFVHILQPIFSRNGKWKAKQFREKIFGEFLVSVLHVSSLEITFLSLRQVKT